MKLKDLTPGLEIAIGRSDYVTPDRAMVLEAGGWAKNRYTWTRDCLFYPDPEAKGVAVAILRGIDDDVWFPDVVPASSIRSSWATYVIEKAEKDRRDKLAHAAQMSREREEARQAARLRERLKALGIESSAWARTPRAVQESVSLNDFTKLVEVMESATPAPVPR